MNDAISGWNEWGEVFTAIEDEWNDMNVCEMHGFITAITSICEAPSTKEWQLLCENSFITELPDALLKLVTEEGEDLHEQFKDTDDAFEFQPLVPDDTHTLHERITAVTSWANGFLTGYAVTSTNPRKDEEELLLNLQQVGRLKLSEEEVELTQQEDEGVEEHQFAEQLEELLEFIRIVPVSLSSMGQFKQVTKLPIIAGLSQGASVADALRKS